VPGVLCRIHRYFPKSRFLRIGAFSGFIQARMLPFWVTPDLLGGMWALLQ
jgi:hypothetical protein